MAYVSHLWTPSCFIVDCLSRSRTSICYLGAYLVVWLGCKYRHNCFCFLVTAFTFCNHENALWIPWYSLPLYLIGSNHVYICYAYNRTCNVLPLAPNESTIKGITQHPFCVRLNTSKLNLTYLNYNNLFQSSTVCIYSVLELKYMHKTSFKAHVVYRWVYVGIEMSS